MYIYICIVYTYIFVYVEAPTYTPYTLKTGAPEPDAAAISRWGLCNIVGKSGSRRRLECP